MKYLITLITMIILFFLTLISSVFYTVSESEQIILTQFGKPVGEAITTAGLKIKTPFIQKAHRFEKRILEWDGYPNQIPTRDKKFIWLDTTARWRIVDPLKFYETLGTEVRAQSRLDDVMDSTARDICTSFNLIEIVRNSNRILDPNVQALEGEDSQSAEEPESITIGRVNIVHSILEKAQEVVPQFGIEIVGIQIKRINYIEEVRKKVYQRMISERQRISEKYKAEGEGEAANIEGQKQKELKRIESEAYRTAQETRGKADAEAIRIYSAAHNQDPDFYSFIKSLETYKQTIGENHKLILTTDSELYKFLKTAK